MIANVAMTSVAAAVGQPGAGQLVLLGAAVAVFLAGGGLSLARVLRDRPGLRVPAKACLYAGFLLTVAVLLWHSAGRGQWLPLSDNFDALLWLALLLTLFVLYMMRARPLGGLDWFVMPVVVLLLVGAGVFGRLEYKSYAYGAWAWAWVHRASTFGGLASFAVAAATGAMYVIVSRRLRRKMLGGPALGSLERLERLTMLAVTLGFALLTIGMVTGYVHWSGPGHHLPTAKVLLGTAAWLVYAVVLHAPITPQLRGRRAALLSICGFLLMVGTIVLVQFLPGSGGAGGGPP